MYKPNRKPAKSWSDPRHTANPRLYFKAGNT
jgi:hypothetical protein